MSENRTIHKYKAEDIFHERYQLVHLIGSGGFADVWSATDVKTFTTVALKIYCRVEDGNYDDLIKEFNSVHDLNHTNILRSDHIDRWNGVPYMTMKLCKGGSLAQRIGTVGANEALRIIRDMAAGLSYLHTNDVVHQDIKPANILVDFNSKGDYYLLSDFGISAPTRRYLTAKARSEDNEQMRTGMTEQYAPPEKFSKNAEDRKPNPKGDIFSLGITMYELCTGHLPFDNMPTGYNLAYDKSEIDYSEISDPRVKMIVMRCMETDKDARPNANKLLSISDFLCSNPEVDEHALSQIDWGDGTARSKSHAQDQELDADDTTSVSGVSSRQETMPAEDVQTPEKPSSKTEMPVPEAPSPMTEAPTKKSPSPMTEAPTKKAPSPKTEAPTKKSPSPMTEIPEARTPNPGYGNTEMPIADRWSQKSAAEGATNNQDIPAMSETQYKHDSRNDNRNPIYEEPTVLNPGAYGSGPKTRLITPEKPKKKISVGMLAIIIVLSAILAFLIMTLILNTGAGRGESAAGAPDSTQVAPPNPPDTGMPAVLPGVEEIARETVEAVGAQ